MVASDLAAQRLGITRPRSFMSRKSVPKRALAAVAPRATKTSGRMTASSASSHGRQAALSLKRGVWWIRRLDPYLPWRGTSLIAVARKL